MSERLLRPAAYNPQDVSLRFMLSLFGFIALCLLLLLGLAYLLFPRQVADRRFATPLPQFPAPQLQPSPRADMQTFYAEEMQRLNSAGWVDRSIGTVHIPIDQAMRTIAAQGIPGWPTHARRNDGAPQ